MIFLLPLLAAAFFTTAPAPAMTPSSAASNWSGSKVDVKSLLVYGDGYLYSVREPDGWHGDTNLPKGYANIAFYRDGETLKTSTTLILVRAEQYDGPVKSDVASEMADLKKDHPNATCQDLAIGHPFYRSYGKVCFVPGKGPSYAAYLDAGAKAGLYFLVVMQPSGRPATADEMAVFKKLVASIRNLGTAPDSP